MKLSKKSASSLFSNSRSYSKTGNSEFDGDYIALALMIDRSVQLGSSDCSGFLCYQGHVASEMPGIAMSSIHATRFDT
jgi:hypothetical protein